MRSPGHTAGLLLAAANLAGDHGPHAGHLSPGHIVTGLSGQTRIVDLADGRMLLQVVHHTSGI